MRVGDIHYEVLPGRSRKAFALTDAGAYRLLLSMRTQEEKSPATVPHLLYVKRSYYKESYQRFDLKDIQALVRTRTRGGAVLNGLLVMGAAFSLLLGASGGTPGLIGGGIIASIFLIGVAINTAFGPTCVCQVRTAVCVEQLPSLGRLRTANAVFDYLKAHIEAVQGASKV